MTRGGLGAVAVDPRPLVPGIGAALSVRGVNKRFGGVVALSDLQLEVEAGNAVAVIGPNGAGKSTLLKVISGFERPDGGQVWLDNERLDTRAQHVIARRGVAMTHQVPRPFANLSVRDNLRVAQASRRRKSGASGRNEIDGILDECELTAKADLPAGSLRVLDLKRLEVARALAMSPTLLMLDEVAAGLAGRELKEAIDLIRRIHRSGLTLLLVEHVERVVREVVERVLVLDWGRQIAEGTPAEVAADPQVRHVYLGDATTTPEVEVTRPVAKPSDPVLTIEGLTVAYGHMVALRDISIQVGPGEIVAVLGANGAGKSTLCGAISGIAAARSGRIRAFGQDITQAPTHRRAALGIAHCQEGRRIFAGLMVRENLVLGAPLRLSLFQVQQRMQRVHAIFPILSERASQLAGTLSGGQQQMLAIGRALMAEPRLLICDELSLGLAPIAIDALYQAIASIHDAGVTILLVEQNVHRSLRMADRAYVLSRGRISYSGSPIALLHEANLDEAYFGHQQPTPEPYAPAGDN